jgi:tetratricopeptide (TPR) repeat protein
MSITQARKVVRKHGSLARAGTALKVTYDNGSTIVVSFRDLALTTDGTAADNGFYCFMAYKSNQSIEDYVSFCVQTKGEYHNLVDALYVLSNAPMNQLRIPEDPAEQARFEEAARQYRAQSVKPVLPEEAWKYKVQADAAVTQKHYDDAIDLYGNALKVAPWWPEGHFNRALLMSNVQDYFGAVQEMKRYLALAPDSPDARKAQDQIYQWEGQIR